MRMLRVAALVAACAVSATAQVGRPLEATLRRGVGEALFYIDQPAYVAVFEVIPGAGVSQLFPRSGFQAQNPQNPGEYLLSRPFRSQYGYTGWNNAMPFARPVYMVDGLGQIASYFYTTGWAGNQGMSPVRTLLLVASRVPLRRVQSPEAATHWLQQVVGFRAISNSVHTPESMLTDIVDAILPLGVGVDDVVVDVLEVQDEYWQDHRWAGRSITFACASGVYSVPSSFFFATGVFYCPPPAPRNVTPVTPVPPIPGDSSKIEELDKRPRRVPPETDVDDGLRNFRRGTITPAAPAEEGFRQFQRGGQTAEEAYRPYRRSFENPAVPTHSTVSVGVTVPIIEGFAQRGVRPVTGAWVPPSSGGSPSMEGYTRRAPTGTYTGRPGTSGYTGGTEGASAAPRILPVPTTGASSPATVPATSPATSEVTRRTVGTTPATVPPQ